MVSGSKFYIYGGGRWREVDINDGSVEGWGRARFLYPRRGKVHIAKTRAVLAALRDLAAGQNSALKVGAHLQHKKIEKMRMKAGREHESVCNNSRCCHHSNVCNPSKINKQAVLKISSGTQYIAKADAGIQTYQTLTFPDTFNNEKSRKRRRETTSSDEKIPTKITTTATIHTDSPKKKVPSLKLEKADSAKYNIYKRRRSKSSDSVVWVVLPKDKGNNEEQNNTKKTKYLQPKSKLTPTNNRQESIKINETSGPQSRKTVQTSDNHTPTKCEEQKLIQKSATNLDEPDIIPLSKSNFKPQTSLINRTMLGRQDWPKELIIGDEDIEVLRTYLLNHYPNFDLLKFDQDDEYKKYFFYKINPLVNVERCPKIARMLQIESQSEMSLKDFASQLGLTSVSEKPMPKRYRMRKRNTKDNDSNSETDKENSEQHQKKGMKTLDKVMKEDKTKYSVKEKMSKRNSTDSDTNSDQGEYHNKNKISDKLFKESNSKHHNLEKYKPSSAKRYKIKKHKNKIKSMVSSNSNTDDESLENNQKKHLIKNTNKLLKELNKKSCQKEIVEMLFNKLRKLRNSDGKRNAAIIIDSNSESEVDNHKLSVMPNRRGHDKNNHKITQDSHLTHTSSSISSSKEIEKIKNNGNKEQNIDPTDSSDEDSEVKDYKLSKGNNRKGQIKISNHKIRNLDLTHTSSEEDTPILSKETRSTNKIKKYVNKGKNSDLTDSDEENFEREDHKSSKGHNRNGQNKINYKNPTNKRKYVDLTDSNEETSEEETAKLPTKEKGQLSKNKYKDSKTPREANTRDRNKLDTSKDVKKTKNIDPTHRNEDNSKTSGVNKIIQNTNNTKNNTTRDTLEQTSKNISQDSKSGAVNTKNTKSKRPSSSARPYSTLEDHAIVSWLSVGGRASCVNGNRIWRELQQDYAKISGQRRTWHSLRNRYLRYVLPALGSLALAAPHAARLRAAAATGEIKSRQKLTKQRRNSIFKLPARGALSRRPAPARGAASDPGSESDPPPPKRHKHDHTKERRKERSPSPKRLLRSTLRSPRQINRIPRYSEITRHFAAAHRTVDDSTPTVSPASKEAARESPDAKNSSETKKSLAGNSSAIDSKESAATNLSSSYRKSLRNKQSPAVEEADKSTERERTRKKLFNLGSQFL